MRCILLFVLSCISILAIAQTENTWFEYNSEKETYSIDANNIHPAAFFKELSLSSGIEIQYDESIIKPIHFYGKDVKQDTIFRFLEKEFSTLTKYKKNKDNQDVLTFLAVLPKGQFQSSKMILAVDPVEESMIFQKGQMNKKAIPTYVTRLDHLKEKVRQTIEKSAQHRMDKQERREKRLAEKQARREERKKQKRLEIEALKESDPELYERQMQRWSKFERQTEE